jgi:ribonuclease Y
VAYIFKYIIGFVIGLIIAVFASLIAFKKGIEHRRKVAEEAIGSAEEEAKRIIIEAERQAEGKKREYLLMAKEEIHKSKLNLEKEVRERRNELARQERRLIQKEEAIDKKTIELEGRSKELDLREEKINEAKANIERIEEQQLKELERISGLTVEEGKQFLLNSLENEVKHEKAMLLKELEEKTKEEAERKAKEIIATAIQKCAADHVSETTVSVVALPNDEMKGRIIGREGRNIRTLETLTGIDIIIDDTPEAVILSGFDPIRREVARIALEKLILDGRIHPARIEEMVAKAQKEIETIIKEEGDRATFETGVHGLHPDLVKLIGKLRYRTSYGQSVLNHSIEVSHLAGIMAGELGIDVMPAKRAGLLHDIGKAVDHEIEGSHVTIGADILRKYNESERVINAVLAHHGDVEPTSIEAILVQAADSISAARPGARRETLESYIKRIEKLEEIADSFDGVDKVYAIQAGREIRIIVKQIVWSTIFASLTST